MKLSEKILYSRKRAGLSQEALADMVGVSRQAVSKWETGEALPETAKLAALGAALGVSVDWLLSDSEPEEPEEEPARPEDWTDKLPRMVRGAAKRWGWLAGVYLAVVGAIFTGMGALVRAMIKSMVGSFSSATEGMSNYFNGMEMLVPGGSSIALNTGKAAADLSVNNPVYIMGSGFMIFGLVLLAAGIVLAIVLKRKSRT